MNKLRKSPDEGVRAAAAGLLRKWKALAGTGKPGPNNPPSAGPSGSAGPGDGGGGRTLVARARDAVEAEDWMWKARRFDGDSVEIRWRFD